MNREEKFNAIKKVSEKAYVSAQISNDDYNDYPNIPVSTIKGGRTFKYIYPSNISPARKAYEEKKVKQQLEELAVAGKKFNISFRTTLAGDNYLKYYLNTIATVIMPQNAEEYTKNQVEAILKNKIDNNEQQFLNAIYDKMFGKNENGEIFSEDGCSGSSDGNDYYTPNDIELSGLYVDYDIIYDEPIVVDFVFTNGNNKIELKKLTLQ